MPITAISIENFKGIRERVRVELKPITLLFGPNSAGKSTIIHALHYAYEILKNKNPNPDKTELGDQAIDLGGFKNLVHQHELNRTIKIRLDFTIDDDGLPEYLPDIDSLEGKDDIHYFKVDSGWIEFKVQWSMIHNKPWISSYETGFDGEPICKIEQSDESNFIYISWLNFKHPCFIEEVLGEEEDDDELLWEEPGGPNTKYWLKGTFYVGYTYYNEISDNGSMFLPILGQENVIPTFKQPLIFNHEEEFSFGGEAEQYRTNLIHSLSSCIVGPADISMEYLERFLYLGPLREIPNRDFQPSITKNLSRWSNGLGAYDVLFSKDSSFVNRVNEWLNDENRLNSGYLIELRSYRELNADNNLTLATLQNRLFDEDNEKLKKELEDIQIKKRIVINDINRNTELDFKDIGVGISQILPVLILALHDSEGLLTIEQPELHIHPAFQVILGDLFVEQIKVNPKSIFLLETHSEHLLLRLLRRIRETTEGAIDNKKTITPENISLNFIESNEQGGIKLTPIRIDDDGEFLDRWPKGFFAERAEELF